MNKRCNSGVGANLWFWFKTCKNRPNAEPTHTEKTDFRATVADKMNKMNQSYTGKSRTAAKMDYVT